MRRESRHNLKIWLLALMVVFAPMQAAVSAIDMLTHGKGRTEHCQHEMSGQMDHANMVGQMAQGDCCQHDGACADNCSSCTQCISVHAMLLTQFLIQHPLTQQFTFQSLSPAAGLTSGNQYRPPRLIA